MALLTRLHILSASCDDTSNGCGIEPPQSCTQNRRDQSVVDDPRCPQPSEHVHKSADRAGERCEQKEPTVSEDISDGKFSGLATKNSGDWTYRIESTCHEGKISYWEDQ